MLTESTPIEKLILALALALIAVIVLSNFGKSITKSFNDSAVQIERAGR